jgi:glycolate oxidase
MTASSSLENQELEQQLLSPSDAAQVQSIFRSAMRQRKTVCVYMVPAAEDVKLDLSRMNRIIEIDSANLVAVVEPGIKMGDLRAALFKDGLRFVPADTQFYAGKTIGEFYYEGCSNISSLKYGAAKHFLMGSEIILPDGQLLKTGGKTVKNVTGYDLTRFMNAPFANFGVTVKFLLKLLPLPESKKPVVACFDSMEHLCGFVTALRQAKIVPAYLLWIDSKTQELMHRKGRSGHDLVLFELDGMPEEISQQWEVVSHLFDKFHAQCSDAAKMNGDEFGKWAEVLASSNGLIVADDLKIKPTAQWSFIDKFYLSTRDEKTSAGLFGQLAEGKLNVYLSADAPNKTDFIRKVISIILAEGGYSSGRFNRMLGLTPAGPLVPVEEKLKQLFDPYGILKG